MTWLTVTSMENSSIGSDESPRETFINSDHLARVLSGDRDNKTKLVFADGTSIKVRESMVKVRAMIRGELDVSNLPAEPKDA